MSFDPVNTIIAWISVYGFVALFIVAFLERFVPVIPSYALLLAVGISASEGTWPLTVAFLVAVTGNTLGAIVCFYIFRWLGETRSTNFLNRMGQVFGISIDSIARLIATFRQHQTVLVFSLQLVPTVRLFAPAFVALICNRPIKVLTATAAGIVIWNGIFIGFGYVAAFWFETINKTALALIVLACLLITEGALLHWLRSASGLQIRKLCFGTHSIASPTSSNNVRENIL